MFLKIEIAYLKNRIKELLERKIFFYAVLLHIIYIIVTLTTTLIFLKDKNDFLVYYKVAETFISDINNLYNVDYRWPFRYFPLSAILFIPFYLLGFELGFIVFNLFNLILTILICIILYKLIFLFRHEDHEKDDKRVITYISIFLMSLPNIFNYILGQINLYVTFLMLLSLLIYVKYDKNRWQFIASLILGISIIIKPITLFLIPFLIVFNYDFDKKIFTFKFKKTIIRIVGAFLPLFLNILLFVIYPRLLEGFITNNFSGVDTVDINHSFSLTKILENFLFFIGITKEQLQNYQLFIFLSVLGIFGGLGFFIYLFRRNPKENLIYGYAFGILIMLISYFDSWDHHLLILLPILIILLFNLPRQSKLAKKIIKTSIFFLSFLDLIFFIIWWLIEKFFPLNFVPTIFIIFIFYGICKLCLTKDLINQKVDLQSKSLM